MNIRDIAKIVGVSSTTVSRVINCSGYVMEETKKKILQVIQETGYVREKAPELQCLYLILQMNSFLL